ncbi:MAG: TatD family hydrolase [bacterium]|nr:TatD family hydrolase [bacterium]
MIDTHCHLTDEPLYGQLESVLSRARGCGVDGYVIPGYNMESWRRARELSARYERVWIAVGLHPLFIEEGTLSHALEEIERGGIIAIGEVGLDYMEEGVDRVLQRQVLVAQLEAAKVAGLPVILHCRHAHDELLDVCEGFRGLQAVLHSCSCSHEQVKGFLELGYYVGFSGGVTRAQTQKVKKLASAVPLDRILVETDSPYIGTARHPAPSSEPGDLVEIVSALASLRGCSAEEMAAIVTENAVRFFSLRDARW